MPTTITTRRLSVIARADLQFSFRINDKLASFGKKRPSKTCTILHNPAKSLPAGPPLCAA